MKDRKEHIPLFGSWTAWYFFVILVLVAIILFFYWLTKYFA